MLHYYVVDALQNTHAAGCARMIDDNDKKNDVSMTFDKKTRVKFVWWSNEFHVSFIKILSSRTAHL